MKLLLVALCIGVTIAAPFDSELDNFWKTYKQNHNKQYSSEQEENIRRLIWEKNLQYVRKHNLEADLGMHTFTLGINEHSDLSTEEYRQYLTGLRMSNTTMEGPTFMAPENVKAPDMVDWRKQGYVTEVKNQGHCGSCWAFSTTGTLEGQHFKKTGKLVSLSEQQLVDCSTKFGEDGCGGGNQVEAYKYIQATGGIDTEQSYPYTQKNGQCHFRKADVGATCRGYMRIPRDNEEDLMKAVASVGPIAVGMDAHLKSFQMYKHGVYSDPECSATKLDHGVLVVGYGDYNGEPYWLVKNSWGGSWGDEGYFMISRNRNMCGIATDASYPLV